MYFSYHATAHRLIDEGKLKGGIIIPTTIKALSPL